MSCANGAALRSVLSGSLLAALLGTSGCVERLLQVRSEPAGAAVYVNGEMAGKTPLDHPFSFYGTVEVTVRREGYLSHRELKTLAPPWYEVFPLDIFSELVAPWTVSDVQQMEVLLVAAPEKIGEKEQHGLQEKAAELRDELKEKKASAEMRVPGAEK